MFLNVEIMGFARTWIILFILAPGSSWCAGSALFDQIQTAVAGRNKGAYLDVVSANPEARGQAQDFLDRFFDFPYRKVILKPAEITEHKMLLQVFAEGEEEALHQSWMIETADENGKDVISNQRVVSTINGLYRMKLSRQSIPVKDIVVKHLDATFQLQSGNLFVMTAGKQPAGVIFIGNATFDFAPQDSTERQQLTLFCKKDRLAVRIESLYVRASAAVLKSLFAQVNLSSPDTTDTKLYSKAVNIAQDYSRNVFAVSLPLTTDVWYPQIHGSDLFCALKSNLGTLLYQYSPAEPEDVALMNEDKHQVINLYRSAGNRVPQAAREDFTMLSSDLRIVFNPGSTHFSSVAALRFTSHVQTSTVVLKLNSALRVSSLTGSQGPLIYFQELESNKLHVVLNEPLQEEEDLQLEFRYNGKVEPELARNETAASMQFQQENELFVPPSFLYSNQSNWYPRLTSASYSPVETRITVPESYTAVSNGILHEVEAKGSERTFHYRCDTPIKYFSLLVADLDSSFTFDSIVPIKVYYLSLDRDTAREYATAADQILRLYEQWFGPYPYRNLNIVLKPFLEPGGHAPATMVIINRIFSYYNLRFRKDPLDMPDFPTFFLAHELAHQWWGQAVGWRTYRDQWLSEGFAQYAAAEYIRARYGEAGWEKVTDQFVQWIQEKEGAGPLILGSRLGHLNKDSQAYTTIVYNKGAYVLNMLKLWLGEENFHRCLTEFYQEHQYKETGLQAFQEIAQKYSQESLAPFFQQWFFRWSMPALTYRQEINNDPEDPQLVLRFRQKNPDFYILRIPVEARGRDGNLFRTIVTVDQPEKEIFISLPFVPQVVKIDPQHENLATYIQE